MIGIIAAVSQNGVIGLDNQLPFDYSADLKHFKKTTQYSTVIMGRKTFEGIGRPLPNRNNIVITSQRIEYKGADTSHSLANAVRTSSSSLGQYKDTWLIGGASIYEEGMEWANVIILTITPDIIIGANAIKFPWINPLKFACTEMLPMEADPRLYVVRYERI